MGTGKRTYGNLAHYFLAGESNRASVSNVGEALCEARINCVTTLQLAFMDISSSTNTRTMIAAILPDCPCGNKVPVLDSKIPFHLEVLCANLNSLAYDYLLRARFGGLSINYHVISDTALPRVSMAAILAPVLTKVVLGLSAPGRQFAPRWLHHKPETVRAWFSSFALSEHERLRRRCMPMLLCSGYTDYQIMTSSGYYEIATAGTCTRHGTKRFLARR